MVNPPYDAVILDDLPVTCDFCAVGHPRYEYPCGTFVHDQPPVTGDVRTVVARVTYSGPWLACLRCHDLLEAGDLDALFERCWMGAVLRNTPTARAGRDGAYEHVMPLWRLFTEHRQGPPVLARLETRPTRGVAADIRLRGKERR